MKPLRLVSVPYSYSRASYLGINDLAHGLMTTDRLQKLRHASEPRNRYSTSRRARQADLEYATRRGPGKGFWRVYSGAPRDGRRDICRHPGI